MFGVIFDTISVKVHWEQWCRWNCDLRVVNARKQAFSLVPKASPWRWTSCAHMRTTSLWGVAAKWLVAACFRVSVYLSVFGIMLCACCSSSSSLEIRTGIFSKSVTLWTALQISLWSKPHLVFRHKVYEIALSEVLTTQMGMTEAQHQSQLVWIVQIWPIFASQRVDSVGTRA